MIDLPTLQQFLLSNGPIGLVTLYLWLENRRLGERLDKYIESLHGIIRENAQAITLSTEAMRSSTAAHYLSADNSRSIAEAVRLLHKDVERLEKESDQ